MLSIFISFLKLQRSEHGLNLSLSPLVSFACSISRFKFLFYLSLIRQINFTIPNEYLWNENAHRALLWFARLFQLHMHGVGLLLFSVLADILFSLILAATAMLIFCFILNCSLPIGNMKRSSLLFQAFVDVNLIRFDVDFLLMVQSLILLFRCLNINCEYRASTAFLIMCFGIYTHTRKHIHRPKHTLTALPVCDFSMRLIVFVSLALVLCSLSNVYN